VTKRSSPPSRHAAVSTLAAAALATAATTAQADPPPSMYAAPPPVAAGAPPGTAAWTRVHIVTPTAGIALERRVGSLPTDPPPPPQSIYAGGAEPVWHAVCVAPCDAAVQLGGEYRIAGEGITASSGFALHGPTTELRVDAGSYSVRRAGVWLTVVGSIAAATGAIFMGVNAIQKSPNTPVNLLNPGGIAAIAAMAGGGTLALIGIGCIVGGGTSVRDEARRDLAQGPKPAGLHATFVF
jgi:hypothetical protein